MKKFLIDILYIFVLFLVFCLCLELSLPLVQNRYSYKYNYLKEHGDGISTLLIGSSQFENSLDPYQLGDSVFMHAIDGRWIYFDQKVLSEKLPSLRNVKTVIFPMGYSMPYFSLHYQQRDIDKNYLYKYTKFMHVPYDRSPEKWGYHSALWMGEMRWKNFINEAVDSIGYSPVYGHCNDWLEVHNIAKDVIYPENKQDRLSEYIYYLTNMARVCNECGVRFVVVTCPLHEHYLENVTDEGITTLYDIIDSVKAKYPVEYYNYMCDSDFREDSIYFNVSHLNSRGATRFAKRLKIDLDL